MIKSGWVKSSAAHSDPEPLWGLCGAGVGPGAPLGGCHHTPVSVGPALSALQPAPHSPRGPGAGPLDPAHGEDNVQLKQLFAFPQIRSLINPRRKRF